MRHHRLALSCLLVAGCTCGVPVESDAGVDAGAWIDARPTYQDTGVYAPRDAGPVSLEPCRGRNRRLRFDDFPFGYRMDGYGDRLVAHERDYEAGLSRLHILDIVAGIEVAVTAPVPLDTFGDIPVAHAGGFDIVWWGEARAAVAQFDRDGAALGTARWVRTAAPAYPISNVIRTDAGLIALLDGPATPMSLEILGDDGSVRNIPVGLSGEPVAAISASEGWVVGAIAFAMGSDAIRLTRLEVDLESGAVGIAEMGSVPNARAISPDLVAAYVDGTAALAAFALPAEVGQPSGVRLVWWTPGGAEIARRDLERLSVDSIGLAGIAGPMPQQTLAYFTGSTSSMSGRGYLLAARVRAPGVIEGGEAPLVSDVDVRMAHTWEWTEGGIAIAYYGTGRLEVLLTCEGAP